MGILVSLKEFLSNDSNNMRLIYILTYKLVKPGINVLQTEGDADTQIFRTAIQRSNDNKKVVAIASYDVDLIIILIM